MECILRIWNSDNYFWSKNQIVARKIASNPSAIFTRNPTSSGLTAILVRYARGFWSGIIAESLGRKADYLQNQSDQYDKSGPNLPTGQMYSAGTSKCWAWCFQQRCHIEILQSPLMRDDKGLDTSLSDQNQPDVVTSSKGLWRSEYRGHGESGFQNFPTQTCRVY